MFLFSLILALLITTLYYVHHKLTFWKRKGVSYEATYSIFGNIHKNVLQRQSMADLLDALYKKHSTEPFFGIHTFLTPTLVVRDLDLIKEIAVKNVEVFMLHKIFSTGAPSHSMGKSLFSTSGSQWKLMRPAVSPAFTGSKMRIMFSLVKQCALQWQQTYHNNSEDLLVVESRRDLFNRFTIDVIATCIFGLESNSFRDRENEFFTRGFEVSDFGGTKIFAILGYCLPRFIVKLFNLRVVPEDDDRFFSEIVLKTMRLREQNKIQRPDMITLLMQAKNEHHKRDNNTSFNDTGFATVEESSFGKVTSEKVVTDEDIMGHCLLFLIAGSDTPALALNMLAYELTINPDVQKRLMDEVDETMEKCVGDLSYEDLVGMKYMDMVCSEILRKYPPLPVTDRVTTRPYTLRSNGKSVHLEAGSVVWLPMYSIQRDPNNYEDPERFDPERFSDDNKGNINKDAYMPFGVGPKACIGSRLAILMIKSIFVYILRDFELVPIDRTPSSLELSKRHIFLNPDKPLWLGLKRRRQL